MSVESDYNVRLAVLEHRVNNIDQKLTAIDTKITELLELRSKGMGAFWVASLLFGTGIFGLVTTMISWMKG